MLLSLTKAKSAAKKLHSSLLISKPVQLSLAQEIVARVWGYKDWHHLHRSISGGSILSEPANLVSRLGTELLDIGASNDPRELLPLLQAVLGVPATFSSRKRSRSQPYETPTMKVVQTLARRVKTGKILVVLGPFDSGKSAIARTLGDKNVYGSRQNFSGKSLLIDVGMSLTPLEFTFGMLVGLTGTNVRPRSAAAGSGDVLNALRDHSPKMIILDGLEHIAEAGPKQRQDMIRLLSLWISASQCPWVAFGIGEERSEGRSGLRSLLSSSADFQDVVDQVFECKPLDVDSSDLKAILNGWEVRHHGSDTFFNHVENRAKLFSNSFAGSHYCVMKMLDYMRSFADKTVGTANLAQQLDYACERGRVHKKGWEDVRSLSDDLKENSSAKPEVKTKFEMISVIDILRSDISRYGEFSQEIRFYVRQQGVDFTIRYKYRNRDQTVSIIAENAKQQTSARFRFDDGVLIASPRGSVVALRAPIDLDMVTKNNLQHTNLYGFFDVRDCLCEMIKGAGKSNLSGDRIRQLKACLDLIVDATGLQAAWVKWSSPANPFQFGAQFRSIGRFPTDVCRQLEHLLWKEFQPVGWKFGDHYGGSAELGCRETMAWRHVVRPRASEANLRERAARRLEGCDQLLIDAIVDLSNLPLRG
jgi:energy-coupling factor transporter ATP-binding protein EcfA2